MRKEYLSLLSEKSELESIIAQIPKDNVIERLSFEARLKYVNGQIHNIQSQGIEPEKAKLTFRGTPVLGTHGIFADFATNATAAFSDAFSAVVAGLENDFHYMGPIPNRSENQLLITGTAIGSFGFELELPRREEEGQLPLFPSPSKAETAFEKIVKLFDSAATGSDDDLSELVNEIHPRAVRKAADFLKYLLDHGAWCGFEFKEKVFKYSGTEQVQNSYERIKDENIKNSEEQFIGKFQGVLPKGRTFEFLVFDTKDVIRGKIGLDIQDPFEINKSFLDMAVNTTFSVLQVGQARPRYTLEKLENISILKNSDEE